MNRDAEEVAQELRRYKQEAAKKEQEFKDKRKRKAETLSREAFEAAIAATARRTTSTGYQSTPGYFPSYYQDKMQQTQPHASATYSNATPMIPLQQHQHNQWLSEQQFLQQQNQQQLLQNQQNQQPLMTVPNSSNNQQSIAQTPTPLIQPNQQNEQQSQLATANTTNALNGQSGLTILSTSPF